MQARTRPSRRRCAGRMGTAKNRNRGIRNRRIPGYGALGMGGNGGDAAVKSVRTPWGNSGELRSQIRRMGRASVPEETERKQVERLFAAMVALSSEHGYE